MHLFFGDDSVRKGARGGMGMLVSFGGILLDETMLRPLQEQITSIRRDFDVPPGEELKWSPRKDSWIFQKLHGPDRTECYRRAIRAAREAGGCAFAVVFDRGRRKVHQSVALRNCIDWCFERVTMCLQDRGAVGLMICDRPGGGKKEEDQLLGEVLETIEQGTDFVRPSSVPLNILTTASHLVAELQLADLIIGVTTAMVAGDTKYATPVFEEIKPMFHRNAYGTAGGAGLKLFPNALLNLHYWVGGEDTFWRVGANTGWSLPWWAWPYAASDADPAPLESNPGAKLSGQS